MGKGTEEREGEIKKGKKDEEKQGEDERKCSRRCSSGEALGRLAEVFGGSDIPEVTSPILECLASGRTTDLVGMLPKDGEENIKKMRQRRCSGRFSSGEAFGTLCEGFWKF